MDPTRWVITLESGHDFAKIGKRLTEAGLAIEEALADIGVVIGTASPRAAERLRAVPGVAAVEPEHPVEIGPPGSEEDW